MIRFYYWPTPNGKKVAIMLEECQMPYDLCPVNILKGEQFDPDFLKISPNNKVPALVDEDGPDGRPLSLFESGAILEYLADCSGRFLPAERRARFGVLQWLYFQVGGVGPMFGQCGHFLGYAPEPVPYAIRRYRDETLRLYAVMERRLTEAQFLGGEYSIADMAVYPWVDVRWLHKIDIDQFPAVSRWCQQVGARPAVQRAMGLMADQEVIGNPDEATREAFFGDQQRTQGRQDD